MILFCLLLALNKMACGYAHTITLSNDGTVHSFGSNREGELGLGHNDNASLPTPIPNLPKINMVSCGGYFTVCVDYEGFVWSFGENHAGQLGTGNTTNFNIPQKLLTSFSNISKISAGVDHTLFQNNKGEIFSCGYNDYGHVDWVIFDSPQITPSLILNPPSNIVQFTWYYQKKKLPLFTFLL